ncbi:TIGR01777 family oxidoreductase [Pedobacter mendelii]|uniref:NAD-dependent epimerase n=1 Tax=Pedobacter mendelii TaxID=1908240 RepID=A0ABQ2BKK7_9SPHI|nr:TIGR01777 family oxidoreductase [Pedobacter mendelii]GGI28145.1 NAD-dependent epimerase [Pedobacter mendelii]
MKYNKIILAGGSGYLGGVLAKHFSIMANEIIILARKPKTENRNIKTLVWDRKTESSWTKELNDADLLINLCGKNVNCRYTDKNREEIINSRIFPTQLLNQVLNKLSNPPKLWINVTSATIYRHAEDKPQDDLTGEIGYGFSIDVCRTWEEIFFEPTNPKTRKIALRMGIVMGRKDGAFPRLLNLVKVGMGGKQGAGEQYVSWIHEQDVARSVEWLIEHVEIEGAVNCTAPNAVKNTEMMKTLRMAYGMPFGLPAPAWLLEIGAKFIGTETELILKSRWVNPAILINSGFKFQYGDINDAFNDILSLRV